MSWSPLTDLLPAAFVVLLFLAASLGLAPNRLPQYKQSDKVLHFVTFFLITVSCELPALSLWPLLKLWSFQFCFYWIIETNRRRVIHFTLVACTAALSIGSEVVQGLLPVCHESLPCQDYHHTNLSVRMVGTLTRTISLPTSSDPSLPCCHAAGTTSVC
jgi:hypothetical protein